MDWQYDIALTVFGQILLQILLLYCTAINIATCKCIEGMLVANTMHKLSLCVGPTCKNFSLGLFYERFADLVQADGKYTNRTITDIVLCSKVNENEIEIIYTVFLEVHLAFATA